MTTTTTNNIINMTTTNTTNLLPIDSRILILEKSLNQELLVWAEIVKLLF